MCSRVHRLEPRQEVSAVPGDEPWVRIDIEDEGEQFFVSGAFLTLDRPRLLRFTWSCSIWPDPLLATTVSVHLDPHGDRETIMTIRHAMLPPDVRDRHEHGWAKIADQLADELTA